MGRSHCCAAPPLLATLLQRGNLVPTILHMFHCQLMPACAGHLAMAVETVPCHCLIVCCCRRQLRGAAPVRAPRALAPRRHQPQLQVHLRGGAAGPRQEQRRGPGRGGAAAAARRQHARAEQRRRDLLAAGRAQGETQTGNYICGLLFIIVFPPQGFGRTTPSGSARSTPTPGRPGSCSSASHEPGAGAGPGAVPGAGAGPGAGFQPYPGTRPPLDPRLPALPGPGPGYHPALFPGAAHGPLAGIPSPFG